jgi:hypothetical protein
MNPTTPPRAAVPARTAVPASPPSPAVVGVRATRVVVTVTSAVIAVCAFAFSFGNIWRLALAWGVPAPIAPLVAPMLDVSVVGLLIAIRHLSLLGIPGRSLAGARLLMLACAVTTWGLNTAQPVLDRRWGGVVIDSVAPALLLGWAEVGPTLLRLTTTLTTGPGHGETPDVATTLTAATGVAARRTLVAAAAARGHTRAATAPPDHGGVDTVATPAWPTGPGGRVEPAAEGNDDTGPWPGARTASAPAWDHFDGEGDLPHVA